ncbi:hypothetical protein BOX15_Mlig000477g2, partial [Macrostomum lignano]
PTMPTPWKGIGAVIGGFLIHFTLGTLYTFGNMSPYVVSYMRLHSHSKWIGYPDATWIFGLSIFGQGASMAFGGLIEKRIGARLTALLGSWIMSLGVLLSYFAVKSHLGLLVVTYGLLFGVGTGIAYAVAIAASMSWFPSRRGLVGGIVVAGFGGGSLVFDQFQTLYINPDNVRANVTAGGNERYFDQPAIIDRVPSCFVFLGLIYALMQAVGVALLRRPTAAELEERQELVGEAGDDTAAQETALDEGSPSKPVAMETSEHGNRGGELDSTPGQMVRKPQFWLLWATFLVNSQSVVYINTQYKSFGLSKGLNDHYLAIVGSLAAAFNAASRVMWGHLHDRVAYRALMFVLSFGMAVLMSTFTLSGAPWYYLLWVCAMFSLFAGNFALFPAACAKLYGQTNLTVNYGLLFTANATSGIIGALLTTVLKDAIGWLGLFLLGAAFSTLGAVFTLLFEVAGRV